MLDFFFLTWQFIGQIETQLVQNLGHDGVTAGEAEAQLHTVSWVSYISGTSSKHMGTLGDPI